MSSHEAEMGKGQSGSPVPSLSSIHEDLHRRFEEELWRMVENLVVLDIPAARRRLALFAGILADHMRIEDEQVLPAWHPLASRKGPHRVEHVEADHVIIRRHLKDLTSTLRALRPSGLRDVLRVLPKAYRLLGVIEHHTVREAPIYRVLEERLPSGPREKLSRSLQKLLTKFPD